MQKLTVVGFMLGTLLLAGCTDASAPSASAPSAASPTAPSSSGSAVSDVQSDDASTTRSRKIRSVSFSDRSRMPSVSESIAMMEAELESAERESADKGSTIAATSDKGSADNADFPVLLEMGDKAPAISVESWVRGAPASLPIPGRTYVVEFWKTTFLPCVDSIHHLAALRRDYAGKVTFVGISPEDEITVAEFVNQNFGTSTAPSSEILNYAIGVDHSGQTWAAWMEASEQGAIPCAFIIGPSGCIEWIGHSKDQEAPLNEVVAGTWDSGRARELAAAVRGAKKSRLELARDTRAAIDGGEYPLAVELIDQLIRQTPDDPDLALVRLQCLIHGGMLEEANSTAEKLILAAHDNALQLDKLAWIIAAASESPGSHLDLALSAAKRAAELTEEKNASVFETMARVQFRKGNLEDAITLQEKALALVPKSEQSELLQATLEEYRNILKPGSEPAAGPAPETGGVPGSATAAPVTDG